MKAMIGVLAALMCASCGGGAAGSLADSVTSSTAASSDPPAAPVPTSPAPTPNSPTSSDAATPLYEIVEIPRLAASGSVTATGVNDQGIVVGQQETTAAPRAWMYQQSSGALDELTQDPAELGAYANGISDSGVIAGAEVPAGGGPLPGFWTVTGGAVLLMGQYQSFTQAAAANDSGTIIGNYGQSGTVSSLPVVWTAPGYAETALPGLRCDQCTRISITASAVNRAGLVVGSSSYGIYDANGDYLASGLHAVAWQGGSVTDLGGLQGAQYSAAYSVNGSGDIVGGSRTRQAAGAPTHAFLYHDGVMTDLGALTGDSGSSANAIDDSGQIVGTSQGATSTRAFLYQNGRMYDLNTLIDPASALAGLVSLQDAVAISSNGWIAVNGTDSRDPGWTRAFVLIPAP